MRGKCVVNSNVRGSVSCSWLKAAAYVLALLVTVQAAEEHLEYYDKVAQIVKEELEKVTAELANATKIATSVEVRVSEYLNQEGVVKVFAWERSVGRNLGITPLDEAISTALKKITNENNKEEVEERAKRLTMLPWAGKELRTTDSDGNLCNNRATYTAKCHTEGSALNFTKATLFGESKQKKKDVAVAEMRVVVAHWFTREGLTEAARALWGSVNESCIAKERSSHESNIEPSKYPLSNIDRCILTKCEKRNEPLPRIILHMPRDSVSIASSAGQNDMDLSYEGQFQSRQLLVYILPAIPALGGRTVSDQELGKVTQMRDAVKRAVKKLSESKKTYSENDERFTQDKNLEFAKSLQKEIGDILNSDSNQELGPFRVGVSVSVPAPSKFWAASAHLASFDRENRNCDKEATTSSYTHRCYADGSAFWYNKFVGKGAQHRNLYVMVAFRPTSVVFEQLLGGSSRVAGNQIAWKEIVRKSLKTDRKALFHLAHTAQQILDLAKQSNLLPPRAILMGPEEIVVNSVGLFGSQGDQDDFLVLDKQITDTTGKGTKKLFIRLLPAREALRRTNLQPGEGTSFSVPPALNGPQISPPASNRRKRKPSPQSALSPSKKPNLERGKSSAAGAGCALGEDGYPLKQNIRDIIEADKEKLAASTNEHIAQTVQSGLISDKGMNILRCGVHIATLAWDTLLPGQFPRRTVGSSGVRGEDEPVVQSFVADHLQQCHRAATLSRQCLQLGGAVEVEVVISDKPKSLLVIYWTTAEVVVLLERSAEAYTRARVTLGTDVGNHLASLKNTFDDAHPLLLGNVFNEVFKKASSMHGGNPPTVPRILWVVPSAVKAPGYTQQFGHVLATSMVYDFSRTINRLGVEIVDRLTLAVFMLPDFPTACAVNAVVVPDDDDLDSFMRMLETCVANPDKS